MNDELMFRLDVKATRNDSSINGNGEETMNLSTITNIFIILTFIFLFVMFFTPIMVLMELANYGVGLMILGFCISIVGLAINTRRHHH